MLLQENGLAPRHFLLGRIRYPDDATGWMLYIKSSLTGDERHM